MNFSPTALLVVLATTAASAQVAVEFPADTERQGTVSVLDEVEERFEQLAHTAIGLDVAAYMLFFDADLFVGLNADGTVIRSAQEFAVIYRRGVAQIERYAALDFVKLKLVEISPDLVLLANEYVAKVRLRSGETVAAKGGGTQVWSKATGEWLLVSVSSSNPD